jgi:hypothetical protein
METPGDSAKESLLISWPLGSCGMILGETVFTSSVNIRKNLKKTVQIYKEDS